MRSRFRSRCGRRFSSRHRTGYSTRLRRGFGGRLRGGLRRRLHGGLRRRFGSRLRRRLGSRRVDDIRVLLDKGEQARGRTHRSTGVGEAEDLRADLPAFISGGLTHALDEVVSRDEHVLLAVGGSRTLKLGLDTWKQVGSDGLALDDVERDGGVLQDLPSGTAPARQDRLDPHAEPGLIDRHHVLGRRLALGVDHSGCGVAGRAALIVLNSIACIQKGHGGNTGGGQNNAEGCQNSKNCAQAAPDGREGGKQPLSVLHDVVSFMGRGRWTYSYSTWLTTEMHEERTHHEAGATAFRER